MTQIEHYSRAQKYIDVDNFMEYMLVNWWMGVGDWPGNNWYGGHRSEISPLGATPLRFFAWDGEWSWDASRGGGRGQVHPQFRRHLHRGSLIPRIWHALRKNSDFMMRFADLAYKNLFNAGPLQEGVAQQRWNEINAPIASAVVAESARWGDALRNHRYPTRTRDKDWRREVDKIHGMISGNTERFIRNLRRQGYYPAIDPPEVTINAPEQTLFMKNPNDKGEIYFIHGQGDPRLSGGALNAQASKAGTEPIQAPTSGSIQARVWDGQTWSALRTLDPNQAPTMEQTAQ